MIRLRFLEHINKAFAAIGGVLFLFIMVTISYGSITRSLGLPSPIWIVQVNEYCLVWVTFLAAAWVLAKNGHVRVDMVFSRLSSKGKVFFRLIQDVVSMAMCGLLCYLGTFSVWEHVRDKVVDVQSIDVPKAWILIVIPVGFLLLTLQFLIRIVQDSGELKAPGREEKA
jgi:C4-dicarboxylate transporter, DctQ subunit